MYLVHLSRLSIVTTTCLAAFLVACVIANAVADAPVTQAKAANSGAAVQASSSEPDGPKNDTKATALSRDAQQKLLQPFAALIGGWRGVGQPKRGSNRGAWTEKTEWVWDFSKTKVSILGRIEKGKLAKTIRVRPGQTAGIFVVELEPVKGDVVKFTSKRDGKKIVGESVAGKDGYVQRLTVTQLNENRALLLLEKRRANQTFYSRIAGVGYTRAGTSLAVAGSGEIVCVVTGGKGTIAVSHKGKKYYVCCSGCKSAFEDDPEGILADYRERLKEEAAKKKAVSNRS